VFKISRSWSRARGPTKVGGTFWFMVYAWDSAASRFASRPESRSLPFGAEFPGPEEVAQREGKTAGK